MVFESGGCENNCCAAITLFVDWLNAKRMIESFCFVFRARRVLVGAPTAVTSAYQGAQVGRGGAVYKCDPQARDAGCILVQFDDGQGIDGTKMVENKTHQWLGATVASAGADGPIVACAPRYLRTHKPKPNKDPEWQPMGTCYVAAANFTSIKQLIPCDTRPLGFHNQSWGMAGFSVAINGQRVFIGAPCSQSCHGEWVTGTHLGNVYPSIGRNYGFEKYL